MAEKPIEGNPVVQEDGVDAIILVPRVSGNEEGIEKVAAELESAIKAKKGKDYPIFISKCAMSPVKVSEIKRLEKEVTRLRSALDEQAKKPV